MPQLSFYEQLRMIDDSQIGPIPRAVLLHIWRVGKSWESSRTLGQHLGISHTAANEARSWLVDKGFLEMGNYQGRVTYQVTFSWAPIVAPVNQADKHNNTVAPVNQADKQNVAVVNQADKQNVVVVNEVGSDRKPGLHLPSKKSLKEVSLSSKPKTRQKRAKVESYAPFQKSPVESKIGPSGAELRTAALLRVCGLSSAVPAHLKNAHNATAQLSAYTAEYILGRYLPLPKGAQANGWNWYTDDFRGQKGAQPTISQVIETIAKTIIESKQGPSGPEPAGFAGIRDFLNGDNDYDGF